MLKEWRLYQDNRKSVGVRGSKSERARHRGREREKEPTGLFCTCPRMLPSLPSTCSFGPQVPRDPPDLSRDNTSKTSASTLMYKCTHIQYFLSLQLSFFSNSFPHAIAYLPIPREMHEYGKGNPRSTCKLTFSVCVVPEMWQGWSLLLHLLIYVWISGLWHYCLLWHSQPFAAIISIVNMTPAVSGYWNRALSCFILFGVSRGVIGVVQVIIFL